MKPTAVELRTALIAKYFILPVGTMVGLLTMEGSCFMVVVVGPTPPEISSLVKKKQKNYEKPHSS